MSYNEIEINGQKVQGHKFVGGAQATLFDGAFPQGSQSVTITDDGYVVISGYKDSLYGTCTVLLNSAVTLIAHPFNQAGRFYIGFPLKKDDVLTITNDNPNTTGFVGLYKYR